MHPCDCDDNKVQGEMMAKRRMFREKVVQPKDKTICLIPLTKGQVAIVSAHRYDELMQWNWHACWDKRQHDAGGRPLYNQFPIPARIRNLVKAGALIAAEIDRLQRAQASKQPSSSPQSTHGNPPGQTPGSGRQQQAGG